MSHWKKALLALTVGTLGPLLTHAQLAVTYGAKGVQTLSYNGAVLADVGANPNDAFHIWHMKATDASTGATVPNLWGETNTSEAWDANASTETYTFSWGTIATHFAKAGNNLGINVTITNNASSGIVFDGAELYPVTLHFPQDPVGFSNTSQFVNTQEGPGVRIADYGSGAVAVAVLNENQQLYTGWKTSAALIYSPILSGTTPDGFPQFGISRDHPVQPGQSFSYSVELRFANTATALSLSDVYSSYAAAFPSALSWTDRRIIGDAYVASSPAGGGDKTVPGGFATNPRRYFNDSTVDVTTPAGLTAFQNRILAQAQATVTTSKKYNVQGTITWDIEGEQYPQDTTYVCSPDQVESVSPEMASVVSSGTYSGLKLVDAYFKTQTDAGLKIGVCIRPQNFNFFGTNQAQQTDIPAAADITAKLKTKIQYAHDRWGARLFYVDSTVNALGGTLDPGIMQQVQAAFPDSLIIPEETWPRNYAYNGPFNSFIFLGKTGTDPAIRAAYPKAFSVVQVNDASPSALAAARPTLTNAVKNGDILMMLTHYDQANNPTIAAIYSDAGAPVGKSAIKLDILPKGTILQAGSTQQFTGTCTYDDGSTDDCTAAGGITWQTSAQISKVWTISGSGLATAAVDPINDPDSSISGPGFREYTGLIYANVGSLVDHAGIQTQHPGDTWYQYISPQYNRSEFTTFDTHNQRQQLPLNVVIGSTVTIGSAAMINTTGASRGGGMQDVCTWTSSNTAAFTINRDGHATAVAPGTADISCTVAGNAVFGTPAPAAGGWQGNKITLTAVAGGTGNATWYVRPDGGTLYSSTNTSGQCDGKGDAAYPGSGFNQHCAVNSPRHLWADGITYYFSQWAIAGGDTIILRKSAAGYNMNYDSTASTSSPVNYINNNFMPTIPSGTAGHPTRILGENYGACTAPGAKTRLFSGYNGINVVDSQYVDVECVEVTDQSACATNNHYVNGCGSSLWGQSGILQSALTAKVTFQDISVHGLAQDAVLGATGEGVSYNRFSFTGNSYDGINMDDTPWGNGSTSVAGGLIATYGDVAFSGCVEEFPVVHNYPYIECRGQTAGGYGDGFGTAAANGDWLFDHVTWRYNTQDGLDGLHSGFNNLTITNNGSWGNTGQTYKIGSGRNIYFANNLGIANCHRFVSTIGDEPQSAVAVLADSCRASDTIKIIFDYQGKTVLEHNTILGQQSTMIDEFCTAEICNSANTALQNNIFVGIQDTAVNGNVLPGMFYASDFNNYPANNGWAVRDHNLYYNVKPGVVATAGELAYVSPQFINQPSFAINGDETTLDNFNFGLASTSPAKGAGITVTGSPTDWSATAFAAPPSMGALEYGSTGPAYIAITAPAPVTPPTPSPLPLPTIYIPFLVGSLLVSAPAL